jgi:PmbA protein
VSANSIVDQGVLNHYLLSNYSAKKLGLASTGNAGGTHNLLMAHDDLTLDNLISSMQEGVLITDLLGHGLNMVNGDFSRGANGFYIKDGQIKFPVEEITVAGNMKNIFMNIEAISNDINTNSSRQIGSVWVNDMTVASAS